MSKENVQARLNALSESDKNLLRLYMTLPQDELIKQVGKFLEYIQYQVPREENNQNTKKQKSKKYSEYMKQIMLYQLTYALKKYNLAIPKKGGKTRHLRKRRATRKLKQ
jgi:hypothetical protein